MNNAHKPREEGQSTRPRAPTWDRVPDCFEDQLHRRAQNRKTFRERLDDTLTEGVDYGRLHTQGDCDPEACSTEDHWSRPVLLKAGAERICALLGWGISFPNLPGYPDRLDTDSPPRWVVVWCRLWDQAGRRIGAGVGCRDVPHQDEGDYNKALKMAEKSAHVDATLRAAGLSGQFTQDPEALRGPRGVDSSEPPRGFASLREALGTLKTLREQAGVDPDTIEQWVQQRWDLQLTDALRAEKPPPALRTVILPWVCERLRTQNGTTPPTSDSSPSSPEAPDAS